MDWLRRYGIDLNPSHWAMAALKVTGKALGRLWGRDVMLYVGGVSFFALLAVFPALAISINVYSLLATPDQAEAQAEALAQLMPAAARLLFEGELIRLAHAPRPAMSVQSALALVIGAYAAFRGFKALLAGLSFIHDEHRPHGFVKFNLIALVVALAAFGLLSIVSAVFLALRVISTTLNFRPLEGSGWLYSEWTWTIAALVVGLTLVYRYAMSRDLVAWRASVTGGVVAALMFIAASWASAFYVEQIVHLGATYGSVATVVVLLIWLSWNVNAIFFGGALATEMEIVLHAGLQVAQVAEMPVEETKPLSAP
jgi:membrane protein